MRNIGDMSTAGTVCAMSHPAAQIVFSVEYAPIAPPDPSSTATEQVTVPDTVLRSRSATHWEVETATPVSTECSEPPAARMSHVQFVAVPCIHTRSSGLVA